MNALAAPARRAATLTFLRGSIIALSISLVSGLLSILYYIPSVAEVMKDIGLQFTSLRPIHTTFVGIFIILAGVAVVHRYLEDIAPPMKTGELIRLRIQVWIWGGAFLGILVTLIAGVFSGREYLGYSPIFSIPIMLGWLLFSWNFFSHAGKGLLCRPMHATMWSVGLLFFIYTFSEQHAWLFPGVFSDPIKDMQLQWKATGTMVGSINLFVYGSLYYIGTKISGDESYAHSRLAYALFGVGLLNSFTNFGHHTYHLPQSEIVKWISFVISMTEIILLARVVWDIAAMVKAKCPEPSCCVGLFLTSTKWWTAFILATSLFISIPPVNTLIHGTSVVWAHGMGAAIGIDAMVLFAAISWMLIEILERADMDTTGISSKRFIRWIIGFNVSIAGMIGWLTLTGLVTAIPRYNGIARPHWLEVSHYWVLAGFGVISAYYLTMLTLGWLIPLLRARVLPE